jgi:hypothetical protein
MWTFSASDIGRIFEAAITGRASTLRPGSYEGPTDAAMGGTSRSSRSTQVGDAFASVLLALEIPRNR